MTIINLIVFSCRSKNAMQSKLGVFNHPIRDSLKRILKCDFKPQAMLPEDELELSTIRCVVIFSRTWCWEML